MAKTLMINYSEVNPWVSETAMFIQDRQGWHLEQYRSDVDTILVLDLTPKIVDTMIAHLQTIKADLEAKP